MNKPELLAPAGSLEKGRMALLYGADAIYLGGRAFGLRAFAANFSLEEIREITAFAHSLGKKVYVTVNIFPHNSDLPPLPDYLRNLEAAGVDALLVSDLGLLLATLVLTLLCGLAHRQVRFAELAGLGMVLACFGGLVFAWGLGLQLPVLPG